MGLPFTTTKGLGNVLSIRLPCPPARIMRSCIYMDYIIFQWIHQWAGKGGIFDALGIFFAEWVLPLTAAIFLITWVVGTAQEKPWRGVVLYALVAGVLAKGIGLIFDALLFLPRPFAALEFTPLVNADLLGSSFPSGHTSFMAALAWVLWLVAQMPRAKPISYVFFL